MKEISVVIPIHNEETNLPVLHERLISVFNHLNLDFEIIFVNDGSSDRSLQIIKGIAAENSRFKYIDLSRNFGHQIAIFAGMTHANAHSIVFMDGDLQDPPELISELYKKHKSGYEVVYARRRTREGGNWIKKVAYKLFYRILDKITDIQIPLDTGDFRIIDKKIADIIISMPEQEKFLRGQIAWVGFNQTFIEYDRPQRFSGVESYTFSKLFKLAMDGITSFSNFPLKMASYLGFIVSGFTSVVIIYTLVSKYVLNNGTPQGWASIMMCVLFIGGIQLISIGIIGEYISRISNNVKQRPIYIIRDKSTDK